jgi:hypothetical protein
MCRLLDEIAEIGNTPAVRVPPSHNRAAKPRGQDARSVLWGCRHRLPSVRIVQCLDNGMLCSVLRCHGLTVMAHDADLRSAVLVLIPSRSTTAIRYCGNRAASRRICRRARSGQTSLCRAKGTSTFRPLRWVTMMSCRASEIGGDTVRTGVPSRRGTRPDPQGGRETAGRYREPHGCLFVPGRMHIPRSFCPTGSRAGTAPRLVQPHAR